VLDTYQTLVVGYNGRSDGWGSYELTVISRFLRVKRNLTLVRILRGATSQPLGKGRVLLLGLYGTPNFCGLH